MTCCQACSCAGHCDEEIATLRGIEFAIAILSVCESAEAATLIGPRLSVWVTAWAIDRATRFAWVRAPAKVMESRKAW